MIDIKDILSISDQYNKMVAENFKKNKDKKESSKMDDDSKNVDKKKSNKKTDKSDVEVSVEEAATRKGPSDTFEKQVGGGRTPREKEMIDDFKNPNVAADAEKSNSLNFKKFKSMTKKSKHNGNVNPPGDTKIVKPVKEDADVLDENKSSDSETFTWGQINKALSNSGYNPSQILKILSSLNKVKKNK